MLVKYLTKYFIATLIHFYPNNIKDNLNTI